MRIIITGGGTGGHTYPALAVAKEIQRRYQDSEILFLGTKRGIESKAVPAAGFDIKFINAAGISLKPIRFFKFLHNNTLGLFQSFSIMSEFKPNLVIASGGFVSAPVVMAAVLKGIPSVLMESNVLPGKTNRLLSRWAKKVLVSFEESKKYLPENKTIVTGNPIRREIVDRTREEACKILNIFPDKFTLLITGASQGAKSINEAVIDALPCWNNQGWQILHLVGRKNFEEVKKATQNFASTPDEMKEAEELKKRELIEERINECKEKPKETNVFYGSRRAAKDFAKCMNKSKKKDKSSSNYEQGSEGLEKFSALYHCIDYTEDMASVYAACDLVIARAGASTMSEITAKGIPAILIPYPYAADNHQEKNARWVEECGGASVILDKDVKDNLKERVTELANDKEKRNKMSEAMLKLGKPEALDNIMKELKTFIS